VAQFSGGNFISPFELSMREMTQFNELYCSCLVTTEFSNTGHKDAWDVMSSEDTVLWLDKFLVDSGNQRINLMKEQYVENLLCCMRNHSTSEFTCAWMLSKILSLAVP
jgi:hypothetical protein